MIVDTVGVAVDAGEIVVVEVVDVDVDGVLGEGGEAPAFETVRPDSKASAMTGPPSLAHIRLHRVARCGLPPRNRVVPLK
jgi:hypothetical protein